MACFLLSVLPALLLLAAGTCLVSAGTFSCRDRSACQSYSGCTRREALYRSGHLCRGFPSYNGGPPITPFKWRTGSAVHTCRRANGSVCVNWMTEGSLPSANVEVGVCACEQQAPEQCKAWSCLQGQVGLAELTQFPSSWGYPNQSVFVTRSVQRVEHRDSKCVCRKGVAELGSPDASQMAKKDYCAEWNCTVRDRLSVQQEEQVCMAFGAQYCTHWEGSREDAKGFRVSICDCAFTNTTDEGQEYCLTWVCYEKGIHFHEPNLAWSWFGVLLATPSAVAGVATLYKDKIEDRALFWAPLLLSGVFLFITTFKGGVGPLLIALAVQVPAVIITLGVCAKN